MISGLNSYIYKDSRSKASRVDHYYALSQLMENLVVGVLQPFPELQIVDCIHCLLTINEVVAKNILKVLFIHKEGIETIRYEQNAKQVVKSVPFCLTLLMHLPQNPKYVYC